MASVYRKKGRPFFVAAWVDENGDRREESTRTRDRRLAMQLATTRERAAWAVSKGLVEPGAERLAAERRRPLLDHVLDYRASLDALRRDPHHVGVVFRTLKQTAEALRWGSLAEIRSDSLERHLADAADAKGTGARTFNAAAKNWRAFTRWAVRTSRISADPLSGLRLRDELADRRRVRRDLSPEELVAVLAAADRSPAVVVARRYRITRGKRRGEWGISRVRVNWPGRSMIYRLAAVRRAVRPRPAESGSPGDGR